MEGNAPFWLLGPPWTLFIPLLKHIKNQVSLSVAVVSINSICYHLYYIRKLLLNTMEGVEELLVGRGEGDFFLPEGTVKMF